MYDAIVIGAGHNGLAAAVLLQQAGLRTLVLEAKRYAGGMASTVELFDGFRFEIAGSLQFPTSAEVSKVLALDTLPTVHLDVMSVSLRGTGDPADRPLVYYTDLVELMTHLEQEHGAEVVLGMAELAAWAQAPTRALGRFEAARPPRTVEEMYAVATTDDERRAVEEMLTASASDVLDRFVPDRDKHGALRGMLAFLACNSQYRGPETPGSAMGFAYGFAVPDETASLMTKLEGGIGALTRHLEGLLADAGGELRLSTAVSAIDTAGGRVVGVTTAGGERIAAPVVVSAIDPGLSVNGLVGESAPAAVRERLAAVDHRGSYVQMHFALDGAPEFAAPYELLNDPRMQGAIGLFSTPEELQQQWEDCRRGIVPADPAIAFQIPSAQDPTLAPPGKHAASAYSLWFPIETDAADYARLKAEMGQRVIDKITRIAPNFEGLILKHTTFTPKHMGTMFGAPSGDWCHGLIHPEQMGAHRPGPTGWTDLPLGIEGLYLGSAGCHGGPGITFIPGYNAAQAVLAR
ncbi:NAD(P)/FAD-dependent oxidoreductase [Nocardioides panacisoli]|uniref:Pyridine nucleotide-disulfide oxidoreductase domain-containing protein 2 n=1 Tax=Nocardioides panacisoli TaxID=627624 RepID=A0ABP7ILM6_9ACTN